MKRFNYWFILIICIGCIVSEYLELFSMIEEQTISFRHILRTTYKTEKNPLLPIKHLVIVSFDNPFYETYNAFPVKRSDLAAVINNISSLKPAVIGIDLLMTYNSNCDDDSILRDALTQTKNVLASQAVFDHFGHFSFFRDPIPILKQIGKTGYVNMISPSTITPSLSRLHIFPELVEKYNSWPFSISILSQYLNATPLLHDNILTIGDFSIPLNPFHEIHIDYPSMPFGYQTLQQSIGLSALEFLDFSNKAPREIEELSYWIKDKIVLIGDTFDVSQDIFDTPIGKLFGVEIIASAIHTLLKGAPLKSASLINEILTSIIFIGLLTLTVLWCPYPIHKIALAIVIHVLFISYCSIWYIWGDVIYSMSYSLLGGGIVFISLTIQAIVFERKMKEQAENEREIEKGINEKIMDSIRYASMIQTSLLPDTTIIQKWVKDSFILWVPKDIVGGDIYYIAPMNEGFLIAVIDCTGHGVPGALMTMLATSALNRIVIDDNCYDPSKILSCLNKVVQLTLQQDKPNTTSNDGLDASICVVKSTQRKIIFAGAKLPILIIHSNNQLFEIKGDRQSIGYKKSDISFMFTNQTIDVPEDAFCYLFTDGFIDQLGGKKMRRFGSKSFKSLLMRISSSNGSYQKETLIHEYDAYRGSMERLDDMTIIGFKI